MPCLSDSGAPNVLRCFAYPAAHHGFLMRRDLHPGEVEVDEQARQAAPSRLRVRHRHDLGEVGLGRASDKPLHAVEDVYVAAPLRPGSHG